MERWPRDYMDGLKYEQLMRLGPRAVRLYERKTAPRGTICEYLDGTYHSKRLAIFAAAEDLGIAEQLQDR